MPTEAPIEVREAYDAMTAPDLVPAAGWRLESACTQMGAAFQESRATIDGATGQIELVTDGGAPVTHTIEVAALDRLALMIASPLFATAAQQSPVTAPTGESEWCSVTVTDASGTRGFAQGMHYARSASAKVASRVIASEVRTLVVLAEAPAGAMPALTVLYSCTTKGAGISEYSHFVDLGADTTTYTAPQLGPATPKTPSPAARARLPRVFAHPGWAALLAEPTPTVTPHPGESTCTLTARPGGDVVERLVIPTGTKFSKAGQAFLDIAVAEVVRAER